MIRPYKQGDEIAIAALERECFSEPWSAEAVSESAAEVVMFFVFEEGGNIIGYAGLQTALDEGYITNVAVSQNHRRQGIGKALLAELHKTAERLSLSFISLEVRESNAAAIKLYSNLGFKVEGKRRDFYTKPTEAALVMIYRFK